MERVEHYGDLAPLISAQFRRGVRTNALCSQAEWKEMIRRGELSAQTVDAGLLLLKHRPGLSRLYFYLNDLSVPLEVRLPPPVVTEIAFRPKDSGLREAADYWREQGFAPLLSRVRLSRPAGELEIPAAGLHTPGPEERERVLAFLRGNFPHLSGCLPTEEELETDLSGGCCLTEEDESGIAGLIRFARSRRGGEIRHLAVRADRRGQGLSAQLIAGCLRAVDGSICTVWTGADNIPARRSYEKFGFRPDGWESIVLCREKNEV